MPANIFVAVVPPAAALAPLAEAVDTLRDRVPELAWVAPGRWHVTLAFLGPWTPTDALLERLARLALRQPPVALRLDGAGRFGDRVLWARVTGDLGPLAEDVAAAARQCGYEVEDRPLRTHITIARTRRTRVELPALVAELSTLESPVWLADELVLMRGGRPDYETVASWPLAHQA